MIKKILPWAVVVVLGALLVLGFANRSKMNSYLSELMKQQASPETYALGEALADSLYNYSSNELSYEITFLEFGAKGCSACKRMEGVMSEISSKYPKKVNVVFLNVLKPESQSLMKIYGIAAIPTQVLLDKNGNEFFRHTGYISTSDISDQFNKD